MIGSPFNACRSMFFTASLPINPLWFDGWRPKSAGTTFAACLGLFGLAILHKLLGALKHQANLAWSKAAHKKTRPHLAGDDDPDTVTGSLSKSVHRVDPWIAEHEIPRGILTAVHYAIGSFIMVRSHRFPSRITQKHSNKLVLFWGYVL